MESLLLDRSDSNAPNQSRALFDLIIKLKREKLEAEDKKDVLNNFTVESPIPYSISELIKELDDVDEIILCNDSCFCVDSLKTAFDKMETNSCDFWSMTASNEYEPHLQSLFLVVKKKLFNSEVFSNYLDNVKHLDSFLEIVNTYEIPLKKTFETEGFKSASFIKAPRKNNPTFFPIKCMKVKMPLIKRKIFVDSYACKHSLIDVILYLRFKYNKAYNEILSYYQVKTLIPVWFKFLKPEIRKFFFRIDVNSRGITKIRVLRIPIFISKQRKIKKQ